MGIILRPPNLADLPKLAELGRDTFTETFGTLYSEQDLQTFLKDVYSEAAVAEELADPKLSHQVLENRETGDLIGFIKIGPVHVPAKNPAPGAMEIWQIYLLKNFIGQGLGEKLITWALDQFAATQPPEIYVSVFSENKRAIRFYQKFGFEKSGEYGFPVGDQIDLEWIMRKTLEK